MTNLLHDRYAADQRAPDNRVSYYYNWNHLLCHRCVDVQDVNLNVRGHLTPADEFATYCTPSWGAAGITPNSTFNQCAMECVGSLIATADVADAADTATQLNNTLEFYWYSSTDPDGAPGSLPCLFFVSDEDEDESIEAVECRAPTPGEQYPFSSSPCYGTVMRGGDGAFPQVSVRMEGGNEPAEACHVFLVVDDAADSRLDADESRNAAGLQSTGRTSVQVPLQHRLIYRSASSPGDTGVQMLMPLRRPYYHVPGTMIIRAGTHFRPVV